MRLKPQLPFQSLIDKVDSTKHLLDRYVAILGQAEHSARLLLDPTWEGAEAVSLSVISKNPFSHHLLYLGGGTHQ